MTGHNELPPTFNPDGTRRMNATQKELEDKNIPLHFRDYCAHILIKLNDCRVSTYYAPWQCMDEKHAYEQCQYDEYLIRKLKKTELDEATKLKKQGKTEVVEYDDKKLS
ncbi:hypothetical protein DICPUDRAFT_92578 [Dictyostelium purpureum]|uniref:NADH dehydrogenase [ubiquinone] 1 beta subcomplex subunit 7 n=1 Tax=Dictyostelium purpureum TaxID=5786 RepID=F0ZU21_DICPU|nr:uncharacterized protein DICPUDRAFT_92578 [Dictyostelium purpureum]EGC32569.1 hypothetical protein DICPUDRAFT_92578 [Dictyostelium purpureum]|eukprot:XP_003290906.1 hypothetical protein DICPUDRAFT_92578 [Dictyostelium purpureum]